MVGADCRTPHAAWSLSRKAEPLTALGDRWFVEFVLYVTGSRWVGGSIAGAQGALYTAISLGFERSLVV